ncbi:MBL fold metallo-hydrolase [Hydrogenophaga sp.]|uniref:MBL fold metallo-hydrolase n=1 Tax=Hydrogenophaga sp. TaxID=1904254 RepID=UPI0025BBB7C9|nr:MBL fold metallo-hydrolase [Hydrogenophaga sp.]
MSVVHEPLERAGVTVLERGWLSANNVIVRGSGPTTLIDSGYSSHAAQTLALVQQALDGQPLDLLLNTHLHSDHCGGNATLQSHYTACQIWIPPGLAGAVTAWDEDALTYRPTGQLCPPFGFHGLLHPGEDMQLGSRRWEIHGAKGHDPHSVVLFEPSSRVLISADALWHNGFGVVFPELEGIEAFAEVGQTLDAIESLNPLVVIPGHGPLFADVVPALSRARSRLEMFTRSPEKHLRHALKVLIKFRLLEWQHIDRSALLAWAQHTPYLARHMPAAQDDQSKWLDELLSELATSKALALKGDLVLNV